MANLFRRSIEIIQDEQSSSGAYVASPTFSQYQACWLRDGALTAYSMDCVGQHSSARRFYEWAARTLSQHSQRIDLLLAKLARNEIPDEADYLPTRFTLDGGLMAGEWWDFQLDGYGAWLWGLVEHVKATNDMAFYGQMRPVVVELVHYLTALWQQPNYDCWEEHRHQIHTSTLAAVYGGMSALAHLDSTLDTEPVADKIRSFVLEYARENGHFVKWIGNPAVDGSLLWVAVPYGLAKVNDPLFEKTLALVESDLHVPGGGVYRYRADVYYGGGEWLLLTAWLGWVYAQRRERAKAETLLHWIESQADAGGLLPEQVEQHLLHPDHLAPWITRWGTSARPLLWSHAMYLILYTTLARNGGGIYA